MTMRLGKGAALCAAAWLAAAGVAGPAAAVTPAWPKGSAGVAPDPAVRFGVLPNGLHYAIMHNETPKGQVAMRLQIEAGSMQEGPGQEGLAHFIEHMAFRGTTRVPDGEMVPSLERLGLQFGPDTNASTSQTATTYMFNLPRNDEVSLERGLFLLREIASELTFDPAIARTESGVVLSEERARAGEALDIAKAQMAQIYGDHPFARLPIGRTEVITAADVKAMRAYYDAWYRPEKAVLVVVGDIDAAAIEARIKSLFSDWVGKGTAGRDPAPLAPSGRSPQFVALDGKPQVSRMAMTWIKPYRLPGDSEADRLESLTRAVALAAFSSRMATVMDGGDKPFASGNLTETMRIGVSRTVSLEAAAIKDWRATLDLLVKSKAQLATYGFTQDELDQVMIRARASYSASAAAGATRPTVGLANALLGSAVSGQVFRTPADTAADFERLAPQVTLARVNALASELFAGEGPLVFFSAEGASQAAPGVMRTAYETSAAAPVERPVLAAVRPWPYADFGTPGMVVERSEVPGLGITRVRFANGVRLSFKQNTSFKEQIFVRARFGRGQGDVPAAPVGLSGAASTMLGTGGLADYSPTQLALALAGKMANVQFEVADGDFTATGITRPADLATQMEVMAARFSNPGWRPGLYAVSMEVAGKALDSVGSNPAAVFTINSDLLLHGGDPRWATPTQEQIAALSAADARAFIEPILTKAPIEVLIAGDTTLDVAIAEVARTFGALPKRAEAAAADTRRVSFPAPTAEPLVFTHTGRPDQAIAAIAWPTNGGVIDPKDALVGDVLAAIMRSRLLEQFRVHDGKTYAPDVTSKASATFDGYGLIKAQAEVVPADIDAFYAAVDKVAADLAASPVSADELARAVSPIAETYVRNRQNNIYWINWMGRLDTNPWAPEHMRTMPAGLTAITPADVQDGARKWLVSTKAWKAKVVAANAG